MTWVLVGIVILIAVTGALIRYYDPHN